MKLSLIYLSCALSVLVPAAAHAQNLKSMTEACDAGIHYYMEHNYSPVTQLVYTCPPEQVHSSADCVDGMFVWYKGIPDGYGKGMSDGPLINGTLLAGLADRWAVEHRRSLRRDADMIARGTLNLASRHGYKGFVARGICVDDGRSICANSSIDQFTHWVHGLWRYAASGMGRKAYVEEYKTLLVEVAEFIESMMTPENEYNFGQADGTVPDSRGICYMYGDRLWPHEAPRLPMIYIAAYMMTGDEHWRERYEEVIDVCLSRTLGIRDMTDRQIAGRMPCYSLYQAQCALELILAYEQNTARTPLIREAMAEFSRRARSRAVSADPAKPPYGMTWDGELILAELMDPAYAWDERDEDFLLQSVDREDLAQGGWCRAAHIYAAYWKYRRLVTRK